MNEPRIAVVVEVHVKMVVDVPAEWNAEGEKLPDGETVGDLKDMVEFWLNDSSHCAGNELRALVDRLDDYGSGCSCNQTESEFLRVATEEDKELYHYFFRCERCGGRMTTEKEPGCTKEICRPKAEAREISSAK